MVMFLTDQKNPLSQTIWLYEEFFHCPSHYKSYFDSIEKATDQIKFTCGFFIDLKKAFDTVITRFC